MKLFEEKGIGGKEVSIPDREPQRSFTSMIHKNSISQLLLISRFIPEMPGAIENLLCDFALDF